MSYRWWPIDSCGEQRQFPVKNCFKLALCLAKMVEITAGDTFSTTPISSCPYATVSHFQFLSLLCMCGSTCHCVSAGILQEEEGHSHVGCFSFTVINHQRVTWLFQPKIHFQKKKKSFSAQLQVIHESPAKYGLSIAASCAKHPHWLQHCLLCICLDRYSKVVQASRSSCSWARVFFFFFCGGGQELKNSFLTC